MPLTFKKAKKQKQRNSLPCICALLLSLALVLSLSLFTLSSHRKYSAAVFTFFLPKNPYSRATAIASPSIARSIMLGEIIVASANVMHSQGNATLPQEKG